MRSSVDDVHHRDRQNVSVCASDVAIKRNVERLCRSLRRRERHAKNSVCAEFALCRCSVERKHFHVDCALLKHVVALESWCDDFVHIVHGFENALSAIARLVAVAKLKRFVFASACSRRNCRTAKNAVFKNHVDFDSRVSA